MLIYQIPLLLILFSGAIWLGFKSKRTKEPDGTAHLGWLLASAGCACAYAAVFESIARNMEGLKDLNHWWFFLMAFIILIGTVRLVKKLV